MYGQKNQQRQPHIVNLRKKIGFIGNCKKKDQPFGVVADLRIYPKAIKEKDIRVLNNQRPEFEHQKPDMYQIKFLQEFIPQCFIEKIEEESDPTNIKILTMLLCFSSKREGRAELLRWDILSIILPFQKNKDLVLRLVAQKLINNLM